VFPTKNFFAGAMVLIACFLGAGASQGGVPFDSARISLIENHVSIGETTAGRHGGHRAALDDVVTAKQFVATAMASRAELKFADHSIVRVGQNSIFSFEAGTRTLSLQKGTMLFYVPPGSGGGQIKTPSLTAAITGTVGKVSENLIAVIHGKVRVNVCGKWYNVRAGWALEAVRCEARIFRFKAGEAARGRLYDFGGPLPEGPEAGNPPADHQVYDRTSDHAQPPSTNYKY
jgi:hypothetical protein